MTQRNSPERTAALARRRMRQLTRNCGGYFTPVYPKIGRASSYIGRQEPWIWFVMPATFHRGTGKRTEAVRFQMHPTKGPRFPTAYEREVPHVDGP